MLAEVVPSADFAALVLRGEGDRLEVVAGVGFDGETPEAISNGLAGEALASGEVRLAPSPGKPFPPGTRAGAAAPVLAGGTLGALLLGSRSADAFSGETLLLLRVAADRAALALECHRLERERAPTA
ncbi:MAG TPA: GAF domain-containing protein, partial [Anaeromyxobacter sp.]